MDEKTRDFIDYWFDSASRCELTALSEAIHRIPAGCLRIAMWIAFSSQIIVKSVGVSRAADVAHSRPHRVYDKAPLSPFEAFETSTIKVARAIESRGILVGTSIAAIGDCRRLALQSETVDAIITSPPYLNAIDYMRTSRFSLVWMGVSLSETTQRRSSLIGAERAVGVGDADASLRAILEAAVPQDLSSRHRGIVRRYACDLYSAAQEMYRVLRPGGLLRVVVGDSTIRGFIIRNSVLFEQVSGLAGLKLVDRTDREIPAKHRYLPPPRAIARRALDKRMKTESVLTLTKS